MSKVEFHLSDKIFSANIIEPSNTLREIRNKLNLGPKIFFYFKAKEIQLEEEESKKGHNIIYDYNCLEKYQNSENNILLLGKLGVGKKNIRETLCKKDKNQFEVDYLGENSLYIYNSYIKNDFNILEINYPSKDIQFEEMNYYEIQKQALNILTIKMICFVIKYNNNYDVLIQDINNIKTYFDEFKKNIIVIITHSDEIIFNMKIQNNINKLIKEKCGYNKIIYKTIKINYNELKTKFYNYMNNMTNINNSNIHKMKNEIQKSTKKILLVEREPMIYIYITNKAKNRGKEVKIFTIQISEKKTLKYLRELIPIEYRKDLFIYKNETINAEDEEKIKIEEISEKSFFYKIIMRKFYPIVEVQFIEHRFFIDRIFYHGYSFVFQENISADISLKELRDLIPKEYKDKIFLFKSEKIKKEDEDKIKIKDESKEDLSYYTIYMIREDNKLIDESLI